MVKCGYVGTFHLLSEMHLDRYVAEFSGRHKGCQVDTIDKIPGGTKGLAGKRLRNGELVAGWRL